VTRVGLLALVIASCGPSTAGQDAGTTTPPVDAGTLGPELHCQISIVGGLNANTDCQATATFARGSPNATTLTVHGLVGNRNPEVNVSLRFALEPVPGMSYPWATELLSGELLITDQPSGAAFAASTGQMIDPPSFSFRVEEVTGRVATSGGGAQLRFAFQLTATVKATPSSITQLNSRMTISVTR